MTPIPTEPPNLPSTHLDRGSLRSVVPTAESDAGEEFVQLMVESGAAE